MDWTVIVSLLTSLFSAIAAMLAWAAKLRWSKEYAAAKDEVIKAKEAQIELLSMCKSITPQKEYIRFVRG